MSTNEPPKAKSAPLRMVPNSNDLIKREGAYFDTHSLRGPLITIGLCLISLAIFASRAIHNILLGDAPTPLIAGWVEYVMAGWFMVTIAVLLITLVILLVNSAESVIRRARHRPAVCPRCGASEGPGTPGFLHQPVEGTGWEHVTCPQCDHQWEAQL